MSEQTNSDDSKPAKEASSEAKPEKTEKPERQERQPREKRARGNGGGGGRGNNQNRKGRYRQNIQNARSRNIDDDAPVNDPNSTANFDPTDIELTADEKKALSSKDMKAQDIAKLTALAEKLQIENAAGMRRQDMIFEVLKRAAQLVDIFGNGVSGRSLSPFSSSNSL